MFVINPRKQKLNIQVKDSLGFADLTIGTAEVCALLYHMYIKREILISLLVYDLTIDKIHSACPSVPTTEKRCSSFYFAHSFSCFLGHCVLL